nr:MAG TPA: hypothetical protein [Caudoviricetes sp.]
MIIKGFKLFQKTATKLIAFALLFTTMYCASIGAILLAITAILSLF